MKNILIVGGSQGIGNAITKELLQDSNNKIYIVDKNPPIILDDRITFLRANLTVDNYEFLHQYVDEIDEVIITAGVGRLNFFSDLKFEEIKTTFNVNTFPTINLVKMFYDKLLSSDDFYFAVITSIAGIVASPLYSLYSSSKAALVKFIEAVNTELKYIGSPNRILNIAPGKVLGTSFHGGESDPSQLIELAKDILHHLYHRETLFIPNTEIYSKVIKKYNQDPETFSDESIVYKLSKNELEKKPKYKIGYLSGTFDMFHIGHLNLLRNAKKYCDYLIVGVHKDGLHKNIETVIPFEERKEILENIKYVDKVIQSKREDSDVYNDYKYDYLFVGSDYKGTERFNRYEEILGPLGVEIIYFPYTLGTSSTKLRNYIQSNTKNR